jgi:UDP-N-acetylglucosamine--N-acetylmuramyl-(pentapeptide) pyrophosphoryl-undecaprenol N-acetylglucosamine transferase
LAVAGELRAEGAEVVFIGGQRAEAQMVPEAGFELRSIRVEGVSRRHPVRAARAALRAGAATRAARDILAELAPGAFMGGGGYVSGPAGAAAVSRRIPVVLTEADSHLGLANRTLAPFARRVCLAFPLDGRSGDRYRVTGRPVLPPVTDREGARRRLDIGVDETSVLVFGGSQGARSINEAALAGLGEAGFHVMHVAGARDYPELRDRPRGSRYDLREHLSLTQFFDALAGADLVVARAGGSIFEIAAHGRPAVLVPYPHATADHQRDNAEWMRRGGAAEVIDDAELSGPRLAQVVGGLLADPARLEAMARASAALARPRAARDVADELLAAAAGVEAPSGPEPPASEAAPAQHP